MKYVLDSSIAFKWVVPELHSDKAERIRSGKQAGLIELIAPDLFPAELANALTRAERHGRILLGQAMIFWGDVMMDAPDLHPILPLTRRAIEISSQLRIGFLTAFT